MGAQQMSFLASSVQIPASPTPLAQFHPYLLHLLLGQSPPPAPSLPHPGACHFLLCSLPDQYTKAAATTGGRKGCSARTCEYQGSSSPASSPTRPGPTWS